MTNIDKKVDILRKRIQTELNAEGEDIEDLVKYLNWIFSLAQRF